MDSARDGIDCRLLRGGHRAQHILFEWLMVPRPILNDQVCVRWIRWSRFNRPAFWPVAITSKDRPDDEPGGVAIAVYVRMNSEEIFKDSACECNDVEKLLFWRDVRFGKSLSEIKSVESRRDRFGEFFHHDWN